MGLHTQIQAEIQSAMKERNEIRLTLLRSLVTAFTNELVAKKRKPDEELSDEDVLSVISRAAKQRKDSIEQFQKGGRDDLAEREIKELSIIESYLPEMLGKEEIEKVAKKKQEELGITDISQKGMLMGAVMSELKNKADGKLVKDIVDNLLP